MNNDFGMESLGENMLINAPSFHEVELGREHALNESEAKIVRGTLCHSSWMPGLRSSNTRFLRSNYYRLGLERVVGGRTA
jgi:hypothetical protein